MRLPSASLKRYFWLPSVAGSVRLSTSGCATLKRSASRPRTSFGILVIASNESTPWRCSHSSICRMRNAGETTSASALSSCAGGRSYRFTRSVVTGRLRERLDAAGPLHFPGRIDADGAEHRQVIHVDTELHFAQRLGRHERGRRLSIHRLIGILLVETDRRVEHDVEVIAFVADQLDVPVHVVRARDRLIDRRAEVLQELLDLVVHAPLRYRHVNY